MKTKKIPRTIFSSHSRATAALALNLGKKAVACSLAYLMIPLGMGNLYAQAAPPPPDQQQYQDQQAPPPPDQQQDQDQAPAPPDQQQGDDQDQGPPPQNYATLAPEQLGQLVAPIALYPDSLVAQILAASTYPDQVADANHFLQSNQGVPPDQLGQMVNGMNWDPSVKALIAFPSVLANLDKNLDWTTQLGNAYYNQPQDVMSAVQDMRQRAYQAGTLRSSQQIAVQYEPGDIVIAPANPSVVYVPYYNPWVVYGAPINPWGGYYLAPQPYGYVGVGIGFGFGVGIAIGGWSHWGWGWNNWGMGWRDHSVVYQRNVYVSNSVHVVNHGYYGHFDRNPAARNYNRSMAMRSPNYRNRPNNNVRTNNNFNRPNNNVRTNNNFNRPNNNVRPNNTYNNNRPNNNARPNNTYNRPTNNPRPTNNIRPAQNYPRPQPQSRPQAQSRPQPQARPQTQSRPQAQARPQARTQSRPASRPSEKSNDNKEKAH